MKALFALLIFTAALRPVHAMAQPARANYRDLEKVALVELKETNTPGAAVAIVSGDRLVYEKGFGIANVETGAPVTPAMLFRTGSMLKMLTASVLVALSEQGRIGLDAPLADGVPGLAPRLSRVTAQQLLSHTAGLIDPARICCAQDERALAAEVRAYKDEDYFFTEPGVIFSYSNTGYIVAGFLIEQLSGESYADAMKNRLFDPLGMSHTTLRPTVAMTFPLSQGHEAKGKAKPTVVRPFVNNVGDWPAGFACTNVGDMARFAIAFMNGGMLDGKQVLSGSLIKTLSQPYVDVPFGLDLPIEFYEGAKYGHGLFFQEHRGLRVLQHGGTINGFGSFIVMVPAQRFAVIVLANKSGSLLGKTVERAMELHLRLKPKAPARPRQALPMTMPEMEDDVGVYANGNLKIELFIRNGRLMRKESYPSSVEEGPGREIEGPVRKIGTDRFLFTPAGDEAAATEFILIRGEDGKPEYLHGNLEAAKKLDAAKITK